MENDAGLLLFKYNKVLLYCNIEIKHYFPNIFLFYP